MSEAASKVVCRQVRGASMSNATGTPKGLTLNSRGQGHAFLCPPPTDRLAAHFPDPEGVERFRPVRT